MLRWVLAIMSRGFGKRSSGSGGDGDGGSVCLLWEQSKWIIGECCILNMHIYEYKKRVR